MTNSLHTPTDLFTDEVRKKQLWRNLRFESIWRPIQFFDSRFLMFWGNITCDAANFLLKCVVDVDSREFSGFHIHFDINSS